MAIYMTIYRWLYTNDYTEMSIPDPSLWIDSTLQSDFRNLQKQAIVDIRCYVGYSAVISEIIQGIPYGVHCILS